MNLLFFFSLVIVIIFTAGQSLATDAEETYFNGRDFVKRSKRDKAEDQYITSLAGICLG